jgi:FkbM family methyltransferase
MGLFNTIRFIWMHPLNSNNKISGLVGFLKWQTCSRMLKKSVVWPFVNDARLIISQGMKGATGNIYVGLMEFEEMGFILHYLRPSDLFLDIGANIGAYTILAAKASGAICIAAEPDTTNYYGFMDNIYLNRVHEKVTAYNAAIGRNKGTVKFCSAMGPGSHVLNSTEAESITSFKEVDVLPLDCIVKGLSADVLKIDVEGYETEVIAGGEAVLSNRQLNAVLIELRGHGKRYGFDEKAIDLKMRAWGFNSYDYDPLRRILTHKPETCGKLGDMLYIRNFFKAQDRVISAPQYEIHGRKI